MTGLGGLDVDDESCRVAQLERADAGRLGQTGAPTQDRLEVAKLLDFLHDGEVGRQIATAAVARRAACSLEDDTETRRPAHRDRQTARILDELRRGLPRHRIGGDMPRGASLWSELEDDPVEARLMSDAHGRQLHCRTCVRTPAVVE